jgi:hypothetical protein
VDDWRPKPRVESFDGLCSGFHVQSETGGRYSMLIELYNTQTLCIQWYRSYLRRRTGDVQDVQANTICASVTGLLYKAVVIGMCLSSARLGGFGL